MIWIFFGLAALGLFALIANVIAASAKVLEKVLPPLLIIGAIAFALVWVISAAK